MDQSDESTPVVSTDNLVKPPTDSTQHLVDYYHNLHTVPPELPDLHSYTPALRHRLVGMWANSKNTTVKIFGDITHESQFGIITKIDTLTTPICDDKGHPIILDRVTLLVPRADSSGSETTVIFGLHNVIPRTDLAPALSPYLTPVTGQWCEPGAYDIDVDAGTRVFVADPHLKLDNSRKTS